MERFLPRSSIGCMGMNHVDILDKKHYDFFLMQSLFFTLWVPPSPPPSPPNFSIVAFFAGCVFATMQLAAAALSIKVQLRAVPGRKALHCSPNPSLAPGFGVRGERWFWVPGLSTPCSSPGERQSPPCQPPAQRRLRRQEQRRQE